MNISGEMFDEQEENKMQIVASVCHTNKQSQLKCSISSRKPF